MAHIALAPRPSCPEAALTSSSATRPTNVPFLVIQLQGAGKSRVHEIPVRALGIEVDHPDTTLHNCVANQVKLVKEFMEVARGMGLMGFEALQDSWYDRLGTFRIHRGYYYDSL